MTKEKNPIPDDKKVDHLFLLVGGNPLPNVVAARLLLNPGGTVYLLHSVSNKNEGVKGTDKVANRIKALLQPIHSETIDVSESNATDIKYKVESYLSRIENKSNERKSVGLNYTGGTKAMAIHSYRAIEKWAKDKEWKDKPVFSYLDSRTMRMRFDDRSSYYVAKAPDTSLSLENLMQLHGEMKIDEYLRPGSRPVLPKTAAFLAKIVIQINVQDKLWNDWLNRNVRPLKKYFLDSDSKMDEEEERVEQNGEEILWERKIPWPEPNEVGRIMREELEAQGYPKDQDQLWLGLAKDILNLDLTEDFCRWLISQWLEHYVLDCLIQVDEERNFGFQEKFINVMPKDSTGRRKTDKPMFEVDVVGIRGYQLFGFSCSLHDEHKRLKLKLFEALVRSRQLGGDEARIILVCRAQVPKNLENEIERSLDQHVNVIGKHYLVTLKRRLAKWIEQEMGKE